MIGGSEGFDDFERFAKAREPWLRKHLRLPGVTFDEDPCRVRKVCPLLFKQDSTIKDSLRGKRCRSALDAQVLEAILFPESSE